MGGWEERGQVADTGKDEEDLPLGSASALREVDHSDSEDNHMAHNKKKARIYNSAAL